LKGDSGGALDAALEVVEQVAAVVAVRAVSPGPFVDARRISERRDAHVVPGRVVAIDERC
jgi:hypothetical protein